MDTYADDQRHRTATQPPPARKGSGGATPSAALFLLDVPLARFRRHALHPAWRRSERTRSRYSDRLLVFLLAAVLLCALPGAAFAHKIHIFAAADGAEISGSVYFSGGGRAADLVVGVFGSDGAKFGEATTDDNGEFTWTAAVRADHAFRVETPDGHGASYTLTAAELPESLPASGEDAPAGREPLPPAAAAATPIAAAEGDIAARVDLLKSQVIEMRKQLDRFQEKKSFQDILGGIGYIIGVAGVAFYLVARRESGRRRGGAQA